MAFPGLIESEIRSPKAESCTGNEAGSIRLQTPGMELVGTSDWTCRMCQTATFCRGAATV